MVLWRNYQVEYLCGKLAWFEGGAIIFDENVMKICKLDGNQLFLVEDWWLTLKYIKTIFHYFYGNFKYPRNCLSFSMSMLHKFKWLKSLSINLLLDLIENSSLLFFSQTLGFVFGSMRGCNSFHCFNKTTQFVFNF